MNNETNDKYAEGNKLISEFYGWRFIKWYGDVGTDRLPLYQRFEDDKLVHDGIFHQPTYHDNWSSLMPVVEKIIEIDITPAPNWSGYRIEIVPRGYVKIEGFPMPPIFKNVSIEGSLINATWKAVIQFITWYNQQKQK